MTRKWGVLKKNCSIGDCGLSFFFNVLRSRTSRPRRETAGRGWWQMDGFRGELPVVRSWQISLIKKPVGGFNFDAICRELLFFCTFYHIFLKNHRKAQQINMKRKITVIYLRLNFVLEWFFIFFIIIFFFWFANKVKRSLKYDWA